MRSIQIFIFVGANHHQVKHAADYVRKHGNLCKFSAQGLEHLHAIHKIMRKLMGTYADAPRDVMHQDFLKVALRRERLEASSFKIEFSE